MPIENHPLTQRSLQFIGIGVNKFTLKSINIHVIQSSNNYNVVSGFICWNQNIVHMKILDTLFKMMKRRFRFREYPYLPVGNIKKQTFARRPHVGRTSIRVVIVMLKIRHHVAFHCIQDFLEVFFSCFSNIKWSI